MVGSLCYSIVLQMVCLHINISRAVGIIHTYRPNQVSSCRRLLPAGGPGGPLTHCPLSAIMPPICPMAKCCAVCNPLLSDRRFIKMAPLGVMNGLISRLGFSPLSSRSSSPLVFQSPRHDSMVLSHLSSSILSKYVCPETCLRA